MRRRDLLTTALLAPMLTGQTRQPAVPAGKEQSGLGLLRRMQEAMGGADRLAAVHDVDWTVLAKTWDASGSPAPETVRRIRWIRPNVFRKDQQAGNITVVE